jgi:hypothetical protein
MINIFNGMPSSIAKMTQANSNSEYALTDELQSIAKYCKVLHQK